MFIKNPAPRNSRDGERDYKQLQDIEIHLENIFRISKLEGVCQAETRGGFFPGKGAGFFRQEAESELLRRIV